MMDLKALQKEKYKEFKADPNAANSEAYKQPASVAGQEKKGEEKGWFDGWFGSSSSSDTKPRGGGGYGPRPGGGGNIKTVSDLPKPPPRAGG